MGADGSLLALRTHTDDVRDRNRAAVLRALRSSSGWVSASMLADRLPLCVKTAISHLRVLRVLGLAETRGRGPMTRWRAVMA